MISTQNHAKDVMKIVKYALALIKMNVFFVKRISYELAHSAYVETAVKGTILTKRFTNA